MRFVNWQAVNAAYCAVIWMIALVLLFVILAHGLSQTPQTSRHAVATSVR